MDSPGRSAQQADEHKQRTFDLMMREEARKRDYGDGVPRWSVYYHGNQGEAAKPGHLTGPPAIGRAAKESLRPKSSIKNEQCHHFRISHANLVSESISSIIAKPRDDKDQIDPVEAAALALIEACDVDGDGQLDLFEIIKALMHRPHLLLPLGLGAGSTELQILAVIKKADEDSSGHVTKEELMSFLVKNKHGKRGLDGMDQGYRAFDADISHADPVCPSRNFGQPLVSRPNTAKMSRPAEGWRFPQNHVCRNEFFTKGEMPGENANVMAARYYKEVGRPFEGMPLIKTCQKPRSLGQGKEWESEIQPTVSPFRRASAAAGWKDGLRPDA